MGRGAHLHVTTAEPATKGRTVVAAAPATVVTTAPTLLLGCLRRLADASRAPTPAGSRPGVPGGPVATPIRPLTGRPSLPPASCTRSPSGSPCGSLSRTGGL